MNQPKTLTLFKKTTAFKFIATLLLLSTPVQAALDIYSGDTNIVADAEYPDAYDGIRIRPGVTLTNGANLDFLAGSSLVFDAVSYNVGTINNLSGAGVTFFAEGSSIIMNVVGTPPPNGTYELIRGEIGAETTIQVILQNYPGASIITRYFDDTNGYIRATIINYNRPSVTQTVIDQTVTISDTTFNRNIIDDIPSTSCCSSAVCCPSEASRGLDYSTAPTIASTLHRFVGANHDTTPYKYTPLLPLPGLKERQTDLLKVINEGQLPTSQFTLPHKGIRVWMTGIYNHFRNKLSHLDYKAQSKGFQIGIDSTTNCLPLGLSFSYIATRPEVDRAKIGHNRTFQVGLYGGHGFNNLKLFGTVSYIHGHNKIGNLTKTNFTTNSFSAYAIGSYLYRLPGKNILEPLMTLSYGRTWAPTIYEYRNSILNSTTQPNETNSIRSEMGTRLSHLTNLNNKAQTPIKLYIQALWKHNYVNKHTTGRTYFTGYDGVAVFSGQRQAKNMADLGTGIIVQKDNINFSLFYGTSFAKKVQNHTGMAGIQVKF
jgi:hypothetical protein